MQTDKLNGWEKAALFTVGSASAFNVLLWALGFRLADALPALSPLGVLRVLFAIVSFVGLDLTITVTVMAQRDGRRSVWAWLTATAAMLAAGGMGLEVASVVTWPWLHAAPVAVLFAFMHHLAAPRVQHKAETLARELRRRETELGQRGTELETTRDEVGRLRVALEQARYEAETAQSDLETARASDGTRVGQLETERDALRLKLRQAETAMGRLETERNAYETQARQLETARDDGGLIVGRKAFSLGQLSEILEIPKSTLGRKLSSVGQQGGS